MNIILILFASSVILSSSSLADDKVRISVYYESLCPDSKRFINGQLTRAFLEVNQITDIRLVPFGKATYTKDPNTNLWKFQCQHGDDECFGNMIHNCFIDAYPKVEEHFRFLNCCMSNISITTTGIARQCSNELGIDLNPILQCANSAIGNELLYNRGNETLSLKPALFWVPWINVNDVHTNETQQEAEKVDLVRVICRNYKGNVKLDVCNAATSNIVSLKIIAVCFLLIFIKFN